jgi:hypothetical protein
MPTPACDPQAAARVWGCEIHRNVVSEGWEFGAIIIIIIGYVSESVERAIDQSINRSKQSAHWGVFW